MQINTTDVFGDAAALGRVMAMDIGGGGADTGRVARNNSPHGHLLSKCKESIFPAYIGASGELFLSCVS